MALIGKSGSGKSQILNVLLRLKEIDRTDEDGNESHVFIDNVSIDSIGLGTLRRAVTYIPQFPTLIGGTLKYNLDPYNLFSDASIISALEIFNLGEWL